MERLLHALLAECVRHSAMPPGQPGIVDGHAYHTDMRQFQRRWPRRPTADVVTIDQGAESDRRAA